MGSVPLDLAVKPLDRIGRVQLGAMLGREGHEGEHIGLGFIQVGGELGQLAAQLIGDLAPLSAGGAASSSAKAVAMKAKTTRRPCRPACARTLPHEVLAAALPAGIEHLGDRPRLFRRDALSRCPLIAPPWSTNCAAGRSTGMSPW
jgi:hypothetical protein